MLQVSGTTLLSAPGATRSGRVICSQAGPSGGPFMTQVLPRGGLPLVRGPRTPVPSKLPYFATPRSVCYLANGLQALTHYVDPLKHGRPGCRHCWARATGSLSVGPRWPGTEAAHLRGWCVTPFATTALAVAVPCYCLCGARGRSVGRGWCRFSFTPPPPLAVPPSRCSQCL